MKKVFNLSVILAVLASALTFTSCSEDDDSATITITGTENAGEYVISAEAEIDEIAIYKESGDNESKMTAESETLTKAAKGQTTFLVNFSLFGEGTYKMSVKDKEGREEIKKNIQVGSAAESFQLTVGGSNSSEGSYISISNKAVYKTTEANANAAAIEIVFDGTTFKSATESTNTAFEAKASATVSGDAANGWSFETSTGYKGTIKFAGADKDGKGTYDIDVTRSAK